MRSKWIAIAALGAGALAPMTAAAQEEGDLMLAATGGVGTALDGPYDAEYGMGGDVAVGLYGTFTDQVQAGGRIQAGMLAADDPGYGFDEGNYGMGMATGNVRVTPLSGLVTGGNGFYVEGGAGAGIIENDVSPVLQSGIGMNFDAGEVQVGPNVRYLHVIETSEDRFESDDAHILMGGVEVTLTSSDLFDSDAEETATTPEIEADAEQRFERDEDLEATDATRGTEQEEDLYLVLYHYGFSDGEMEVDEAVFFDTDSSALKPRGESILRGIARQYEQAGKDWDALTVEGHADERGAATHNMELSRNRAQSVKNYLVSQGVPASVVNTEAYGEREPIVSDARTEYGHAVNRRVQFNVN